MTKAWPVCKTSARLKSGGQWCEDAMLPEANMTVPIRELRALSSRFRRRRSAIIQVRAPDGSAGELIGTDKRSKF